MAENTPSNATTWQLRFAGSLRAEDEIMRLLERTEDDLMRMWLVICLVDGMDKEQITQLASMNLSKVQSIRGDYLEKKYSGSVQDTVSKLKREVAADLKESREVRASIEQGLDAALKEQVKVQQQLVASKDEMIEMLKKKLIEKERQMNEISNARQTTPVPPKDTAEEQVHTNQVINHRQEPVARMAEAVMADQPLKVDADKVSREKRGVKRLWNYYRNTVNAERFINEFLKDNVMSNEQKEFLLGCLENGMKVKDIEMIASPNLPVDIMRRLQKYYEGSKQKQ